MYKKGEGGLECYTLRVEQCFSSRAENTKPSSFFPLLQYGAPLFVALADLPAFSCQESVLLSPPHVAPAPLEAWP